MECLMAPSLRESHFTLQELRLLSSKKQSSAPVSQVSQPETKLVKKEHELPQKPHWKKLLSQLP